MQKHEIYQNQVSFIPTFAKQSNLDNLPTQFTVLLSEADIAAPPTYLKQIFQNQLLTADLKKGPLVIYGQQGQDKFEKVLVLYSKSTETKTAYKTAQANLKKIVEVYRGVENIAIHLSDSLNQEFYNQYVYGLFTENYQWQFKSSPVGGDENAKVFKAVKDFQFFGNQVDVDSQEFRYNSQVAKYNLYGKELMNTRANVANTYWMAEQAKTLQKNNSQNVDIELIQGNELLERGLRLMHAVGRASCNEPILVVLNYKGDTANPDQKTAMVGKGVIYDCGGLSLKSAMTDIMHADKGGACSVLAAFRGVVELGLKINVVCTLALVENSISSNAYRVSDIIETYKGITVEVANTDAEGRNILADALTYTQLNYKPQTVFDVATLTGAALVSMGLDTACLFTNNDDLQDEFVKHSRATYEPLHPLPITDWMRENVKSEQGDIRNLGNAPWGGSGTAAAFLENFIEKDVKWAHFDIAAACCVKGNLLEVRTLIEYCKAHFDIAAACCVKGNLLEVRTLIEYCKAHQN